METVFGPLGDSAVLALTASSQAFALGSMPAVNPAIRLIALNPSHMAWYLKFGTSGAVTVSRTDGMRLIPGSKENPVIIPVPTGSTHVAILCEGASGDILASYGGFDNGEFSPLGASQIIAVTATDQRIALPTLSSSQPAIRLISTASNIQALWVKLGNSGVTGSVATSMKVFPGSVENPTIIPVTSGETHLSIFCEGVGGDLVLTGGGVNYTTTRATSVLMSAAPRILGLDTGAPAFAKELTLSQILDFIGSAAQGDILYRGGSAWARLAAGTSGRLLKTLGSGQDLQWAGAPNAAAVQASTSGTAINFSSLPSGINRITIIFDQVSLSGTNDILVQIGDAGGLETTAYVAASGTITGTNTTSLTSSTTGFLIRGSNAGRANIGHMVITRITGETWVSSHALATSATLASTSGGGVKTLSADLDRLSIIASGADTFDGGQINIFYE